jgi:hypothetical protein
VCRCVFIKGDNFSVHKKKTSAEVNEPNARNKGTERGLNSQRYPKRNLSSRLRDPGQISPLTYYCLLVGSFPSSLSLSIHLTLFIAS